MPSNQFENTSKDEKNLNGKTSPFHNHLVASSNNYKMESKQDVGRITPQRSDQNGVWNVMTPTAINSRPSMNFRSYANVSPLSSGSTMVSPPASTTPSRDWKAPDSKAIENNQNRLQLTLTQATNRAVIAERKAAEYLQAKEDLERQLKDHHEHATTLLATTETLTSENETLKDTLAKLQKHAKNCEKATAKAQKDAENAKGLATHSINSQKGQLVSAEKRYGIAARELKVWKDRYGDVEKPAEQIDALQKILRKWSSKAEDLQGEIARLKKDERGSRLNLTGRETETSNGRESVKGGQKDIGKMVGQQEERRSGNGGGDNGWTHLAEVYKSERDMLLRMLREEVAGNAKMAESLVLRNAKVAEEMGEMGGYGGK